MAPLAVSIADRGGDLHLIFLAILAGVNSGVEQGVDQGGFSGTAAAQKYGSASGDEFRDRCGVVAVIRADGEYRIHTTCEGVPVVGELFGRYQVTLGENQRDLHPGSVRQSGVAFNSPNGRLGEAGLNDAEHIHVGGDRLICGFSGGAGSGEVASPGQYREGFVLRRVGCTASSGDGLGEYPVADDGVLFFAVVVLNRTQRSGKLNELTLLAGQ